MQLMEAQGPVGTKVLEFKSSKTNRQFTRKSLFSGRRFAKNPVFSTCMSPSFIIMLLGGASAFMPTATGPSFMSSARTMTAPTMGIFDNIGKGSFFVRAPASVDTGLARCALC
jgi:sorbitol-specific phosphotransferase system component IIC